MNKTVAESLDALERRLDVKFNDQALLRTAITHRSYLNEHPKLSVEHNERLEFLGDAVLEMIVTEHLYDTYDLPEGDLTNLRAAIVRGEMLSKIAAHWDIDRTLLMSKGERRDTGKARQYILANAVEAIIGAIHLDCGYSATKRVVHRDIISHLPEVMEKGLHIDAKSKFQELAQEHARTTPSYTVISEHGPDHAKEFRVAVSLGGELWGEGKGTSKQEAEQHAAEEALHKMQSVMKQQTTSRNRRKRSRKKP